MATVTVQVDSNVMPWCPPVSFNERPEHAVKPSAEEIAAKKLNQPDIQWITPIVHERSSPQFSPLLALPLELRTEIYRQLHLITPLKQEQLAPWYPAPVHKPHLTQRTPEECPKAEDLSVTTRKEVKASLQRGLLNPNRPLGGLPTALLLTNRQIYHEARQVPFLENEFKFVNWFSSGVWAARAFTRNLRSWQTSSLRQIRLELLSRDLLGQGAKELKNVCTTLSSGLRGLRLTIAPGGSKLGLEWLNSKAESWTGDVSEEKVGWGWAEDGLGQLKALRKLEIELLVPKWSDGEKREWCKQLEGVLMGQGLDVAVVSVERVDEGAGCGAGVGRSPMGLEALVAFEANFGMGSQ